VKRPLSRDEAALWARLARTVSPISRRKGPAVDIGALPQSSRPLKPRTNTAAATPSQAPPPKPAEDLRTRAQTLDATWDRKLAQGRVAPDFTIDLHGHSLDSAHNRLDHMLSLAAAQGARLVLLITGKQRPSDGQGGRGERRGAIRAKFTDWLASGQHASRIAAIRPAHPRHGGAGAVYLVLRRPR